MELDEARRASRANWDKAAARWERQRAKSWASYRHLSEWLVDRLEPRPGATVLDLAAGPGDTGFLAAERIGPEGRLISTDFSPEMVAVARRRAAELGLENVEFRVMDAEQMDLPDAWVDAVVCRWGLMLMLDPAAALARTRRVLRPGGRLAFAVVGAAEHNAWATIARMTIRARGHKLPGDPWGPGGVFSLADPDRIGVLLEASGFGVMEIEEIDVPQPYDDFTEYWEGVTDSGPIADLLRGLDVDEVGAIRSALEEQTRAYATDGGGFVLSGRSLGVAAE